MTKKILLLNGPNLNKLGSRETSIYGAEGLQDIEKSCINAGKEKGLEITCRQSNHEGELVDWIQEVGEKFDGIIINAGAYTHTSVALLDALRLIQDKPIIEVHMSNIYQREEFRHTSYISPVANGIICGFGKNSYFLAIDAIAALT
ncbi:MAG: type II 3-dehydroquinate dehydratase [Alphaproteobacteria bacterium]